MELARFFSFVFLGLSLVVTEQYFIEKWKELHSPDSSF